MTVKDLLHRCIRDRDGNVVIGQSPNLPVKVAVVAALLALVLPGQWRIIPGLVAFGASFTWAWLELFDGTTPLRRVFGGIVMAGLLGGASVLATLLFHP